MAVADMFSTREFGAAKRAAFHAAAKFYILPARRFCLKNIDIFYEFQ